MNRNYSEIWTEIVNAMEKRYYIEDSEYFSKYDEDEMHIICAIEEIIKSHNVEQYTLEQEDCFDSPAYDTGAVFAAWIENGKLFSISFQWESR